MVQPLASNRGSLYENVEVVRLTPDGEVLDDPPVNICISTGMAIIKYPILATNGQEILCVTGIAGEGLYGSIFNADLNVLVDRFKILEQYEVDFMPRVVASNNNFFISFMNEEMENHFIVRYVKLVTLSPDGQILSIKNVNEENLFSASYYGVPTSSTLNDTTYITYFNLRALRLRGYYADGNPIDSNSVIIAESQDYNFFLDEISIGMAAHGYTDLIWANERFCHLWPISSKSGMTMLNFTSDLVTIHSVPLNSQCQIKCDMRPRVEDSYSIIRAASIGKNVLTAWTDDREGNTRVYGNLADIGKATAIELTENRDVIPDVFSISQNYQNLFNTEIIIRFQLPKTIHTRLKINNMLGQEVKTLVNEEKEAGYHNVVWNGKDNWGRQVRSGIYFCRIKAGQFTTTKKMLFTK